MKSTAIIGVLSALALGACASDGALDKKSITPTEHFAIEVQSQPETLQLAVHREGASARQIDALAAFARQWSDLGGGEILVQSPANAGDPAAAYRTATDARDILVAHGVPTTRVRIVSYQPAAEGGPAAIVLTYPRYKAKGPECGRSWGDLTANSDNTAYNNFGCAVTANTAAQIANPADLLSPRDTAPPDSARRQVVLDKYRQGVVTSTAKDEQANGAVSTAVQ